MIYVHQLVVGKSPMNFINTHTPLSKTTTSLIISFRSSLISISSSPASSYNKKLYCSYDQRRPRNSSLINSDHHSHMSGTCHDHIALPLPQCYSDADAASATVVDPAAAEGLDNKFDDDQYQVLALPEGLHRDKMPRHVGVIVDGHRRWARQRGLPVTSGHSAGARSLREIAKLCAKWGIEVLTVIVSTTETWERPRDQVNFLMSLFESELVKTMDKCVKYGIHISVIGDLSNVPDSLSKIIAQAEETTKECTGLKLVLAISYGGKQDIVQACRRIVEKSKKGEIRSSEDIDETLFERELLTKHVEPPCPDLVIRASGECRLSNFMLWQVAYSEFYFAITRWPDFGEEELIAALRSYQSRERRFGYQG